MRNIEFAIENWRKELLAQESILSENIEEMEDHLRTSYSQLLQQGLSEDEAFFIASKRLGASHKLDIEFSKVNQVAFWGRRLQWMIIGFLLFQAFSSVWMLFTRASSEYLLMFTKSPGSSGVLFIILSAFWPVILWLGLRNLARANSLVLDRFTVFLQGANGKEKLLAGCLIAVFLFKPAGEILLSMLATRDLSPQIYGEYYFIVSAYGLISGVLFPVFGIVVLFWLNHNLTKHTTTK